MIVFGIVADFVVHSLIGDVFLTNGNHSFNSTSYSSGAFALHRAAKETPTLIAAFN